MPIQHPIDKFEFQLTPARGYVAQAAEFILRRGGRRIGMHIEKTAEVRDADAARLRGDFGIILIQLFKETFVNCHSALDAESSDFKFRCAAVFNAAGCRVKPGMT